MWYQETRQKVLTVRIEQVKKGQESKLFQSYNLLCYTREWVKREEKEILQCQKPLFIYSVSATLESSPMLWCTICIFTHGLTHHDQNSNQHQHATSPDVATSQSNSLCSKIMPPPLHHYFCVFQCLCVFLIQFLRHPVPSPLILFLSSLVTFELLQYSPSRLEVLQELPPRALASVHTIKESHPLHVGHPRTLPTHTVKNHTLSNVFDTVTEVDIPNCLQYWTLGTPLCHQPPLRVVGQSVVRPEDYQSLGPKVKYVELGEFVWIRVIPIHMQIRISYQNVETVPIVTNINFVWVESFVYDRHPTKPQIPTRYSARGFVIDLVPLPVMPNTFSFLPGSYDAFEVLWLEQDPDRGVTGLVSSLGLPRTTFWDPFLGQQYMVNSVVFLTTHYSLRTWRLATTVPSQPIGN